MFMAAPGSAEEEVGLQSEGAPQWKCTVCSLWVVWGLRSILGSLSTPPPGPWGAALLLPSFNQKLGFPEKRCQPGEGNGNPLHCSCLENSTDRAWRATVQGVAKSHD